ncbi:Abi family protein [Rothia nasimurium]|uniref:Abi family protein n=1 Tax=Rothia nasimurium TaxID=85336 RepID=UPI001F20295C|nr:Abi family protein [Rothia nasimurium]
MQETHWVEQWLSAERWETYKRAAHEDSNLALRLYEWNTQLAGAIMHDVAHIEVALRNTYNRVISDSWPGSNHWLLDSVSPVRAPLIRVRNGQKRDLNARNRLSIDEAAKRTRLSNPLPGQIIAELSFGFWRHLTSAALEKTLWVPYLHEAFPSKTDRKKIDRDLALVNGVRNRAAHHEPLFTGRRLQEVTEAHQAIGMLAFMFLPELGEHLRQTSSVNLYLENRPSE